MPVEAEAHGHCKSFELSDRQNDKHDFSENKAGAAPAIA